MATKCELYNDHFQNFKVYGIPHAQLIIADPPYNLGKNAYASNPVWYVGGTIKMAKAKRQTVNFSTQIKISDQRNSCTFAVRC